METNNYVPEIYIGENGNWFINGSDTGQPSRGPQGIQGLKGDKGDIGEVNDLTPTYTVASELTDLASGEKVSLAFGKIAKAVSTLISHVALKASESSMGHVKLSGSTSITEKGACALDAVEKNVGITGTLANQISYQSTRLDDFQSKISLKKVNQVMTDNVETETYIGLNPKPGAYYLICARAMSTGTSIAGISLMYGAMSRENVNENLFSKVVDTLNIISTVGYSGAGKFLQINHAAAYMDISVYEVN